MPDMQRYVSDHVQCSDRLISMLTCISDVLTCDMQASTLRYPRQVQCSVGLLLINTLPIRVGLVMRLASSWRGGKADALKGHWPLFLVNIFGWAFDLVMNWADTTLSQEQLFESSHEMRLASSSVGGKAEKILWDDCHEISSCAEWESGHEIRKQLTHSRWEEGWCPQRPLPFFGFFWFGHESSHEIQLGSWRRVEGWCPQRPLATLPSQSEISCA